MAMLDRLFLRHPRALGETYGEHQRVALSFALALIGAGLVRLLHALVPGAFERTASGVVKDLHQRMSRGGRGLEPTATAEGSCSDQAVF